MATHHNTGDAGRPATVIAAAFVAVFVCACGAAMGLDLSTALKVIAGLGVTALLARASQKYGTASLLSFGKVWPVLLGLVWISTWPAFDAWAANFDYWTANSVSFAAFADDGGSSHLPWWDAWYTQMLGLAVVVAGGYGVQKLLRTRY